MINRYIFVTAIFALAMLAEEAFAQTDADARVVEQTTQVVCKNKNNATEKHRVVYEILNQKGKEFADVSIMCDKYNSLSSFLGIVTDASGKEIKKIKKGDLNRTEYSSEAFATDDYLLYYEYTPPTYPITVTYEWTEEMKGGLLGFPAFVPQMGTRLEVVHSKYELTAPADMGIRYKAVNMPSEVEEKKNADGTVTFVAEVNQLAPVPDEDYHVPALEMLPAVYFAPSNFNYLGTSGNSSTWEDLGKWQYGLLDGRDELTDEFKASLHAMTDTCTSVRSKIAVVYQLMEKTTRYVSIQLGIGGLQPFPAKEVCRTGFGDCKGLTNYMRAMLKELGIRSVYCTINSGKRRDFYPDFASSGMSNHVVLCVPEASGDSLWIECTNATLPLGYVHSDIAGHHAMAVDEQGGHLVRLPEYADTLHLQMTKVDVNLAADGSAQLRVQQRSEFGQYEDLIPLRYADDKKRKEWVLKNMTVPQASVSTISVDEHREPYGVPCMNVTAEIDSRKYANITGARMFVPVNPTHRTYSSVPNHPNRKGKVYVGTGYRDIDVVTIHIPDGFTLEALPAPVQLKEAFGEFEIKAEKINDQTVAVNTSLTMHRGTYPVEAFKALYEFKKKVLQQYHQQLVLKK